jgi:hypothetical protein
MTDKIQKIREELERLKEETSIGLSEHENGVEKGRMEIINALSLFLDTVQKEPVSNVWHDAQIDPPQAKKRILAINEYGFCEVDYAIIIAPYWPKVIKWAYIDDLLKLDNSCQSCENLQEETVSEDLEEEIDNYVKRNGYDGLDSIEEVKYIANHFAKWQKEQMMKVAKEAQVILTRITNATLAPSLSSVILDDSFKEGDKVKVILIKED